MNDEISIGQAVKRYYVTRERLNELISLGDLSCRTGEAVGNRQAPKLVSTTELEQLGLERRPARTTDGNPEPRYLEQHLASACQELERFSCTIAAVEAGLHRIVETSAQLSVSRGEPGATGVDSQPRRVAAKLVGLVLAWLDRTWVTRRP